MENQRNYQLLNQFLGMKCSVSIRSLTDFTLDASCIYQSFTYYLEDQYIYFEDETNDREAFTYFELDKVKDIKNLCDDLYHDVVTFLIEDEYVIDVCTLESKPVLPRCHKCGNEIQIPEDNWHINGIDGYENRYDSDVWIIHNLNFCTDCIENLIGELPDNNPYRNIDFGEYSLS